MELVILTLAYLYQLYALVGTLAKLSPRKFLTKPPYVILLYPYLISPKDIHTFSKVP